MNCNHNPALDGDTRPDAVPYRMSEACADDLAGLRLVLAEVQASKARIEAILYSCAFEDRQAVRYVMLDVPGGFDDMATLIGDADREVRATDIWCQGDGCDDRADFQRDDARGAA